MDGSVGGTVGGWRERDLMGDISDEDLGAYQARGGVAAQYDQTRSAFPAEMRSVPSANWPIAQAALTHDADLSKSRALEPEPAPLEPLSAPLVQFDLNQLHSLMERTVRRGVSPQHELEMMKEQLTIAEQRAAEQRERDAGCPALCVKYGWWPLAFLLGSLVAVVYYTSKAAHASVTTQADRDKAAELAERKRVYYEQQAADAHAATAQEGLDTFALLFLAASLLFCVYGMYAFCTRPKDTTRYGLPTQEEVEEQARACREATADAATHGDIADADDDDTAALISAFEACDVDGSGQIDAAEFHAILAAIGTSITPQEVEDIVAECERFYANFAHVSKVIRKVPLFAPLPEWQLRQVTESLQTIQCEAGDVVIREGESGQEMYLIEEGELACTKEGIHQGRMLRRYSAGDFFGERALLVHERRAATITALTRCTLHKLTSRSCQDFLHANKIINEHLESIERAYKASMLRKVPLLEQLPDHEIQRISRDLVLQQFNAGAEVIQEGDVESRDLYIVELGTMVAKKRDSGDRVLKLYNEGDFFGERALMSNEARAASVYAETDARVLKLSAASYQTVLRHRSVRTQLHGVAAAYGQQSRQDIASHLNGANKAWQRGFRKVTAFKPMKPAASLVSNVEHIARAAVAETEHMAARSVSMVGHAAQDVVTGARDVTTHVVSNTTHMVSNVVADVAGLAGLGGNAESVDEDTQDGELDFEEFCQLMRGPLLAPHLAGTGGDWRKRVAQIQQLRRAYDIADVDGDNELEKDELALVLVSLNPSASIQSDDIDHVWNCMNPTDKPFLTWAEFLGGLKGVRDDERASRIMDLGASNKWELISLLIDTKSSDLEHNMLMEGLSFFEKLGVFTLEKLKTDMDTDGLKDVLSRVSAGTLHILSEERKTAIRAHRRNVAIYAFAIAFATNFIPGVWENWTVLFTGSVGVTDAYWVCNPGLFTNSTGFPDFPRPVNSSLSPENIQTCPMSQPLTLAQFWVIDMAMGIVCIVVELVLLGMVAVRCSCMIASEYSFRLVPLNAERAFVSNALIRACFEMGNPKSPVLGVDPDAGPETTVQRRLKIAAMAAIYGGKIVLTGVIIKQIFKQIFPIHVLTWAYPYAVLMSSCFWDTIICAVIMEEVELTAMGVATAPEVFNEVMERFGRYEQHPQTPEAAVMAAKVKDGLENVRKLSPLAELQVVRAIAVAIVLEGSMHPTMELLLRHAIQYFGMKGKPVLAEPRNLDSVPRFLSDMAKLSPDEQLVVMCIHLLTMMLDGEMDDPELILWQRVGIAIGRGPQMDEDALRGVACAFRNRRVVVAKTLECALDDSPDNDESPSAHWSETLWHEITKLLLR